LGVTVLSPSARINDKNMVTPKRTARLYIEDVEEFKRRFPYVPVREYKGRPYADIRNFKITRFIKFEKVRSTAQHYSYGILLFCRFRRGYPDELIEEYRRDKMRVVEDLREYVAMLSGEGYAGSLKMSFSFSIFRP